MGKVILITGISTGFGKESASLLASAGHKVYGTVRRECDVTEGINLLTMDLTDHDSIRKAVRLVVEREGRIDVLVNNAGMHTGGPVETLPEEYVRLQMETSFMGMVLLTREVLPVMRAGAGGRIINISSIGGLMGLPYQGFYSAAKFAVEGFSEALRMEVQQFNISVVVINPGDFHTNNTVNRRKFLAASGSDDPYAGTYAKALKVIEHDEAGGRHPALLARKLEKIIECRNPRQRYIIATPDQKLAVVLKRVLPGRLFTRILGSHYGIPKQ
ncbi:MAG: SDR family oxidoreductase [Bacteroidales bacterium]|nr:SDR family oxidoreductase [Bacteroidales bacterium]